jgi:hypothetical protein
MPNKAAVQNINTKNKYHLIDNLPPFECCRKPSRPTAVSSKYSAFTIYTRVVEHPHPSNAEVTGRVELYLYSYSWHIAEHNYRHQAHSSPTTSKAQFKAAVSRFLTTHSFYCVGEFCCLFCMWLTILLLVVCNGFSTMLEYSCAHLHSFCVVLPVVLRLIPHPLVTFNTH